MESIELSIKLIGWASSLGITALLGYLIKIRFLNHPKLRIRAIPLYFQNSSPNYYDYEIGWRFEITIDNNSSNNAYNINFIDHTLDAFPFSDKGHEIALSKIGYRVKANESLSIQGRYSQKIDWLKEVLIYTKEEGEIIIHPGMKVDPKKAFKPNFIDNLNLLIKYTSESGGSFYTKYSRIKISEAEVQHLNTFFLFNPYSRFRLIRSLASLLKQDML